MENKHIFLLFKRDSDGYCSPKKFRFQYDPHHRTHCLFCHFYPDTTCEGEKPDLASGLEPPKPGQTKRKVIEAIRKSAKSPRVQIEMSPSSSVCSSPQSSPEHQPPLSPDSGCGFSDTEMYPEPEEDLKEIIGPYGIPVPAEMIDIYEGLFAPDFDAPSQAQDIPITVGDTEMFV